jgi:hypothetical protein
MKSLVDNKMGDILFLSLGAFCAFIRVEVSNFF